jgi:hypothetical protein
MPTGFVKSTVRLPARRRAPLRDLEHDRDGAHRLLATHRSSLPDTAAGSSAVRAQPRLLAPTRI